MSDVIDTSRSLNEVIVFIGTWSPMAAPPKIQSSFAKIPSNIHLRFFSAKAFI
jgi:hypothetical protein